MAEMTMEDLLTGLANRDDALAGAITAYAMRPQKSSVVTNTSTTETPYALADMIANRDRIGQATRDLDEALKIRESTGFSLANALAAIPQQQGYGSWLSDFARAFGGGMAGPMNAYAARAAAKHDNEMKDLETILKYDKEMGKTQNTTQTQTMKYDEMPYGMPGGKGKGNTQTPEDKAKGIATTENVAMTLGDLYKTIDANPQAFSATGGIKQDATSMGLKSGVDVMGVDTIGKREFQYLKDLMPNGFATTINAAKEQEIMRPYTTKFHNGRGSEKKATIKGMLGSIYDAYSADAAAQGYQMPISKEQYIQSRIDGGREINAEWFSKPDFPMYKVDPAVQERQQQKEQTEKNYMKFLEGAV